EIETRYRTNVLTVPIQSVTTRMPKSEGATNLLAKADGNGDQASKTSASTNTASKNEKTHKPAEVVFLAVDSKAKQTRVKRGISDDDFVEIVEGVSEGQEVISGGYKAINRELEEGKAIKVGAATPEAEKK